MPATRTDPLLARSRPPSNIKSEDFPDPDGPIRAKLSPVETFKEMFFKISIVPALLSNERCTFDNAMMGIVMKRNSLVLNLLFSYGPLAHLGKILALSFLTSVSIVDADERVDILMIGDSLTQGYGLKEQDGLVHQMSEYALSQGYSIRLINAGVSGDTTAGGLERIAWSMEPGLDAAIVALGGNDMLRGIAPEVVRTNMIGILEVIKEANIPLMIVGSYAPNNYGSDYKEDFDRIFPELAQDYDALYLSSLFDPFIINGGLNQNMSQFFQADGLHPNAEGVTKIIDSIGPVFLELIEATSQK